MASSFVPIATTKSSLGSLEIDSRTTLTEEQAVRVQDLRLAGQPVTTARPGISSEARPMDLGWGPWSEIEGGGAKFELLTDPRDFPLGRVFQPLMGNLRMAAAGAPARP